MFKEINYSLGLHIAEPLQTASSATDEQLISSTVTQEILLQRRSEREREKRLRN